MAKRPQTSNSNSATDSSRLSESSRSEVAAAWRAAWKLPDKITPSQWAEKGRYLTSAESAEPGMWRNIRTPYLVGLMDAVVEPGVEEVAFVKPTQVGGSEALRNILGYWIEEDPGPCLIVMPSEQAARDLLEERLAPLIKNSPSLRRHWSGKDDDITHSGIVLDSMSIYLGWAGSPQSLATRPCRYVVFDEVDKYPMFSGREADPISLGTERTATYKHRRKILKISTPTTRAGHIWRAWEASGDRRYFHVPCPHCGEFQPIAFQQLKWEKLDIADPVRRADVVEQGRLAWFECRKCSVRIEDYRKPKMLQQGRWVSEEGCSKSKRVAFHLDALYSPWRSFASEAAEFIRAQGDPGMTMNVVNSRRAMPFDNVLSTSQPSKIRDKATAAGPPMIVPAWAACVFTTVDTQKDWFKLHIRAWGGGFRSHLLHECVCYSFEEVYKLGLETQFESEVGRKAIPFKLLIDTGGSRTNEVYEWALRDVGRIIPCKGAATPQKGRPFTRTTLENGLSLCVFDTGYFKDMLHRLIYDSDESRWMPYQGVSEQYCIEMAAEHRTINRRGVEQWDKKTPGARNEAWDCEVLQTLAAYMHHLGFVQQERPADPPPTPSPDEIRQRERDQWLPDTRNWV